MDKITFTDRMRYAFDNTMSRGTAALIGWLGLLTLGMIIVFASIAWFGHLIPEDMFFAQIRLIL